MAKTERDKLAAKARKAVQHDPAGKAEWRAAWERVFERLHEAGRGDDSETAREAMLRGLLDGKAIAEAEEMAFRTVVPVPPPPY